MKLVSLDAKLIRYENHGDKVTWHEVVAVDDADGLMFLCPKCFRRNAGRKGTHSVVCWFVGRVPVYVSPGPGRWSAKGDTVDDITFTGPCAASVLIDHGCRWHGFIRNGEIVDA